jgi:hypothetical protein
MFWALMALDMLALSFAATMEWKRWSRPWPSEWEMYPCADARAARSGRRVPQNVNNPRVTRA